MKKINESFNCINCGKYINKAKSTCRNHCPYCFVSLHLDKEIPGDRKSDCKGIMYPIEYEIKNGTIKITFKCFKCLNIHKNKVASDDEILNLDKMIKKYKDLF